MAANFTMSAAVESALADLEIERKKIASSKTQGRGAVLLGIFCLIAGTFFDQLIIGLIIGAIGIIPGAIILYRIGATMANYKMRFKKEIIGAAMSHFDNSLTFEPYRGIIEAEFRNSQLFTIDPDRYFTEDLVSGKVDKTGFYFAEVHAEYKTQVPTKNGTRTVWHDIFKGIIFAADFNKHFNGITVVRPKDVGSSLGAWFSKHIYSFGDKNVVELENEYFNKNFVTHSTDQVEARYILTPALMEKISDLNERSAYCVSLSFINSSMYLAFPLDQNYFEPPVFKTLLRPDLLDNDLSILHFMYDIIRELDLNTRIWTKQ
jgi:hypothetical protein